MPETLVFARAIFNALHDALSAWRWRAMMRPAGSRKPYRFGSIRESHCFNRKHPAVGHQDAQRSDLTGRACSPPPSKHRLNAVNGRFGAMLTAARMAELGRKRTRGAKLKTFAPPGRPLKSLPFFVAYIRCIMVA